ncbi:MAG: sensor histidine kinase, partial [Gammaproteobacteria bacterium]
MAADGVRARLGRAFLLQSVFIGAAAVVGVFLASLLLEGVLIRQALSEEAAHFWQQRDRDPA